MEDDEEKIVILISGCSSGIGAAAAEAFAKETPKYRVWASMRNTTQWKGDKFENLELIEMDVKDTESVENAVNHVINCEGKIDVIINNAGYGIAGFLETVSIAEAQKLFDTNVWGPVRVLQAVLPHMRSRRKGYVINTSSTSGIRGVPCMDYYTGSKFALEGIMDSLRYTLAQFNIPITNVNAGPTVKTAFLEKFAANRGTRQPPMDDEHVLNRLTDHYIAMIGRLMANAAVCSSNSVAEVLVNLVALKLISTKITDVPFNQATCPANQAILDGLRTTPSGWGGMQNAILKTVPNLIKKDDAGHGENQR